jgi:phosphate/phosphite/phosphonate ABC transporter binding protein
MKRLALFLLLVWTVQHVTAQELRIAVYQYADNPRIKNLQPFADHIQKESGVKTFVKSYPTVHQLIQGIQQGEADLAFINTFGYLLLQLNKAKHPMRPLTALIAPNAKDNYKTAFVCQRKDSTLSIKNIGQHSKQLRLAFVAKGSTSGNMVPRLLLNKWGVADAEKEFSSVTYAGTHESALKMLLSDSADVAAMGSTEWDKLHPAQKDSLHLLFLSSEIPLGPVLINKTIDKKLAEKIKHHLLHLHLLNTPALEGIKSAWSEAKQATHFIEIKADYYQPYLEGFGSKKEVEKIIKLFVQ